MLKSIVSQVINGVVGKISDDLEDKFEKFTEQRNRSNNWCKVVEDVVTATEGIDKEIGNYVFKQLPIITFRRQLFENTDSDIITNFVLTLAIELCKFNKEEFSIPLGIAVAENCIKMSKNQKDFQKLDIHKSELKDIIDNREELYKAYFKLFDDINGIQKLRVFYPKNGESWIRWEKDYSVDINVNLSKGLPFGFCREGFDYQKILDNDNNGEFLKCAYIRNEKEILRFKDSFSCDKDDIIVWLR